ncbi:AraC family transcriptional regulator [Streptomyces bambusae]|uniref:AraC family transcriptional regulator n=1 Tax=Streptomyces bambusae TaxID=1550616 RepID=UPI001CFDFC06|nr:AraC family transcriptional regulator [Streptomyces bambusae]MCB5168949.1 AraC family transcriptional regulator [Streptomyces bambusae]
MDALTGLLNGPRAQGAFLLRMVMQAPWSVRIEDRAALCVMLVRRGEVWIEPEDGAPVRLGPGGVALARGPAPYTVCDAPGRAPRVFVDPEGQCTGPAGEPLGSVMQLGVRTWGDRTDGDDALLVGTYRMAGEIGGRLLNALPPLLAMPGGLADCPFGPLLDAEAAKDQPGQEVVLDRLLDLMLIDVLRTWFSRPEGEPPGWYRALGDPVIGGALRLLQDQPARPWTVASLAAAVGMSRAAFARRFAELVGEPPMAYLTGWRLALAADLLRDTDDTLDAVARKVGYSGSFALSSAFKRVRGISPSGHRARV